MAPHDLQSSEKRSQESGHVGETDSNSRRTAQEPDTDNVFALYSLRSDEEKAALAARYKAGGMGYGDAKKAAARKVITYFAPYREKRAELSRQPDYVAEVLRKALKRRAHALQTLNEAKGRAVEVANLLDYKCKVIREIVHYVRASR